MSDVMEKAVAALPSLLSESFGVSADKDWGHSRNFQAFVKHVSSLKSKTEEDALLERELSLQKQKLAQPNQSTLQTKESLIRILYCDMLGKDVSFACIHAVKLAQQGSILDKKVGYLVCNLLMNKDHELVMLLINTMQKDLSSSNVLHNLAGLTAVIHLCSTEMVPAMLPLVKEKLNHPKDAVRKKAVMAMHHFLQLAPEMIQHEMTYLQRALTDKDPSVVWATLHVFSELVPNEPSSYLYLVPSLLNILGQIVGRKLSTEYDYHTVPAPWMTIMLLRLLAKLGAHDESASQQICPALKDVLQKTEPSHKMGLAVIFECLQTITRIYPHPYLLQQAVSCVGKFIYAKNINLKYLGLKALVSLVTISSECTMEHQDVVLDCLEHSDPTIQRMTLQLLYQMANCSNVKVISAKMLEFMSVTSDQVIRSDIVHKVIDLTERYSSDLLSYLATMNQVIQTAESFIPMDTVQTVLWKISHDCVSVGDESDPLANKQLRATVFQLYLQMLQNSSLPDTVIEIAAWVLGEYNHCVRGITPSQVINILLLWYKRSQNDKTRCQIVSALQKMAYYITDLAAVMNVIKVSEPAIRSSYYFELKQRTDELEMLCKCKQDVRIAANPETRLHLDKMDLTLTFLDEFVCKALEAGAAPYRPRMSHHCLTKSDASYSSNSASNLNFAPYEMPSNISRSGLGSSGIEPPQMMASLSSDSTSTKDSTLKLKSKKKVWTKEGVIQEDNEDIQHEKEQNNTRKADVDDDDAIKLPKQERECRELTQEQLKRKQLADAIFGDVKPKGPQQEQAFLVSLPSGNLDQSVEAASTESGITSSVYRSQSAEVIGHAPDLKFNPSTSLHTISNANGAGLASSDSKNSLSQLLGYDTISSVEDLSGTMASSSHVNQSETEHQNKLIHIQENVSRDKSDSITEPFISSTSSSSLLMVSKDTKPLPWKLVGHGKQIENGDEIAEDNVSIEVDSIEEDDPPSEFKVETTCANDTMTSNADNKHHDSDIKQQQLEHRSCMREHLLAENVSCLCYYEKIHTAEGLTLVLKFRLRDGVTVNIDRGVDMLGSLLIEQNHYDITTEHSQSPSNQNNSIQLTSIELPSDVTVYIKHPSSASLEPLLLSLILPGDRDNRQFTIELHLTEFLRPLPLEVEQFAEAWTADDDNVFKRTSIITEDHKGHSKVIKAIGFQIIQEKGSEVIFASRWMAKDPQILLLHTKCSSNTIQVSVKGQQVQVVSAVTSYIQDVLTPGHGDVSSCSPVPDPAASAVAESGE